MANYNKQVFDFRASAGVPSKTSNEIQRKWTERGWQSAAKHANYDPSRRHLNFEIGRGGVVRPIDTSKSIGQKMAESLKARGIVDPNDKRLAQGLEPNRRTVVNIIFGGSRDRMNQLAFGEQTVDFDRKSGHEHIVRQPDIEQWAQDMYKFACDKWGEENVISFVVHLDELNAHAHCTVLPVTPANKISFKQIFAGKDKVEFMERTRRLHDELSVVNAKWGLGRGQPIRETGAKHKSTEEYLRELREKCNEGEIRLESLYAAIRQAERRVKGLNTMIANLEQKQSDLSDELEVLEAKLAAGADNADELRLQIAELERRLHSTQTSLEDKRQKLHTADRQLADLKDQMGSLNARTEDLKREGIEAAKNKGEQMRLHLTDAVFNKTVAELKAMVLSLTPQQKAAFDSDFLEALAERPMELMRCAMYLMAGYVDGAIQFAKGSGGGGGSSSDLKWGRDPNEDDRKWAFRCMMQAHRMLKPAKGQQVKRK